MWEDASPTEMSGHSAVTLRTISLHDREKLELYPWWRAIDRSPTSSVWPPGTVLCLLILFSVEVVQDRTLIECH